MNIINEIEGYVEIDYYTKIAEQLSSVADNALFIRHGHSPSNPIPNKTIAFVSSDETYSLPTKELLNNDNIIMILKNYHPFTETHPKVREIPLGYVDGFCGNNKVDIRDRDVDYCFVGAWNKNREGLLKSFSDRQEDGLQKVFHMNRSWCGQTDVGLSIEEYSGLLSNTKISLCPPGYERNESFRIFESAMCGNIIVCEKPCPYWYYEYFPYIEIDEWDDLSVIDRILSIPEDELQEMSNQTRNWYDNFIRPEVIANYIQGEFIGA
jgi:hypothetical protein